MADADFDDEIERDTRPCPNCKADHSATRTCWNCGGEGYREVYSEDPGWYEPDDTEDCSHCTGHGFLHWCQACGYDFHTKRVICGAPAAAASSDTEGARDG